MRVAGGVALCLTLLAAPASAQSPEVRADLERFRLAIAQTSNPDSLRSLEHRFGSDGHPGEPEALRRIRRGFVRLRIGQLGDGWSFGKAADDFGRATELEPDWTEAWQARGLAEWTEGRWQAANRLNLGKRVGLGSIEDAVRSFARAIAVDSTNAAAGRALFETALELRDTARFKELALPALRQVAQAGAADTGVLLALARAERLMGDSAAALAAGRSYLDQGGTRGLGLRELAWSAFVAGEVWGDSAYYAGAVAEDSVSVAAYREDLALIADDTLLAALDRLSGAARVAWLRTFWEDKARAALRSPEERLREHYRRLTHAERYFGLEVNRRHFSASDMVQSGSMRFDDRGIVYIRYGDPAEIASTVTFGIQPNQTWHYLRADGDLLLHFAANAGGDIRDYRLIPGVMAIGGVDGDPALSFALNDRCAMYPAYCKLLVWGPYGRAKLLNAESAVVRASVAWAITTDGFDLGFAKPLEAAATAFAVGSTPQGQLVHVVYQVAVDAPDSIPEGAVFQLPLRVRANLFDPSGHSGGWIDTTTTVLLQGGEQVRGTVDVVGRVTVAMPPGRWRYQIALSTRDSTGLVLPTDSLDVAPFDGGGLVLSDLVLSKNGRGARWVPAEGDTAYFNPRRVWLRSDTLALYHEIYGLPAGSGYSAKLVVRKGRRAALTLKWDGVASGAVTRVNRTLSFETVRPGDYELEVEVRDPGGRRAVSSRHIRISN